MASTNQSPFYKKAEIDFLYAKSDEERLECLEIMIRECPKHKGAEKMLAGLRTRYKKILISLDKQKKSGKTKQQGIKKDDMQLVILGFTNVGKSTLFNLLTGQKVKVSSTPFTTYEPNLAMMDYDDVKIQTLDNPPFPNENRSLVNSADVILLVIDNLNQIKDSEKYLTRTRAKIIVLYNKADLLSDEELRKLEATINSKFKKHLTFILSSEKPEVETLNQLKKTIFSYFPIIRVYTKEPKKQASKQPMILKKGATLETVAEKILKGMSTNIKRARIWGPSSKFGGQTAGLKHELKDKDIIEFQTK
ncbi:50S ribosome-binding GTPase [archaeon]|nr:50S ribosome-binding GTPase [archaeon]